MSTHRKHLNEMLPISSHNKYNNGKKKMLLFWGVYTRHAGKEFIKKMSEIFFFVCHGILLSVKIICSLHMLHYVPYANTNFVHFII